jgi:hypothetical protein
MQLKRWESPRRQGRNDKGRGGSARQRQLRKRQQHLRNKLKEGCPALLIFCHQTLAAGWLNL